MAGLLAFILVAGLLLLPCSLVRRSRRRACGSYLANPAALTCLPQHAFSYSARATSGSWLGCPCFFTRIGWHFMQVAGFLAAWTIAYGGIQAIAPSLVTRSPDGLSREIPAARLWAALNAAVPVVLIMIMQVPGIASPGADPGRRIGAIRRSVRGQLIPALVSDPGLCRIGESRRRCRVLLCGQCHGPPDGNHSFGVAVSSCRDLGLPDRLGGDAGDLLACYVHASCGGSDTRLRDIGRMDGATSSQPKAS